MSGDRSGAAAPQAPLRQRRYLSALSVLLDKQREALTSADVTALNRLFTQMSDLMIELESDESARYVSVEAVALARAAREQVRLNQVLVMNGLAITDHFAAAVAEASGPHTSGLFSGVA